MPTIHISENIEALRRVTNDINLFTTPRRSKAIASLIVTDIKSKIEDERDVSGKKFKPLSKRTIEIKRKEGKIPYKIMRDTGELINSLNYTTSSNSIIIGYGVPYADKHQFGTKRLPIRKILPTKEDEIPLPKIKRIITKYLKDI